MTFTRRQQLPRGPLPPSQPWAARYRTPPVYLYLLAFAVKWAPSKSLLMRIIGMVGLTPGLLIVPSGPCSEPTSPTPIWSWRSLVQALFEGAIGNPFASRFQACCYSNTARECAAPGQPVMLLLATLLPAVASPRVCRWRFWSWSRRLRTTSAPFLSPMPAVVAILRSWDGGMANTWSAERHRRRLRRRRTIRSVWGAVVDACWTLALVRFADHVRPAS